MPRAEKKYHFIYKTTNLVNGKYYVGMHSTDDLTDGYLGSGVFLKRSVSKYGNENHKFEILEFCSSRSELKNRESDVVNESLLADPFCMNLKAGGIGGFTDEMRKASHMARKQKLKNDPVYKAFISEIASKNGAKTSAEGRKRIGDRQRELRNDPEYKEQKRIHAMLATKNSHSPEAKAKRVANRLKKIKDGWVWIRNCETLKRKFVDSENAKHMILNGWERIANKEKVEMNQLNAIKVKQS
ncbi:hypothetical protein RsoM2USA_129 [Ralstonia phage RsoM2USA]|nr:hypothetical protein RsoM2USA_129 [Ralstonia phage RsoM2USA]